MIALPADRPHAIIQPTGLRPHSPPCMSRVSIDCPHCGKTTRVDLALTLSTQKCDRCGVRFSAVDTGLAGSREVQLTEPPDWRRAKSGDWEESAEEDTQIPTPPSSGSRAAWIAVGISVAAITATALTLARRPPPTPTVKPSTSPGIFATATPNPQNPSGYLGLRDRIDAATVVARQFLSATSVDELLPLIENREALEPKIRAFYSDGEGRGQLPLPEFSIAPTDRQVWIDSLKTVVVSYNTPGQVPRAVALRQANDGRWLVDWPSAAAVGEVPLSRFRADRDPEPRFFRLLATRDDYFNRAFASDRDWVCLRLSDTRHEHRLYGYARRGTPAAEALLAANLSRKGVSAPIMVRLRFPENAPSDDQAEITEFLGQGWLEAPIPTPTPASPPPASHTTR
jgi:hypothetical protein